MPDAAVFDVTRFFTSLDEEGSVKKNNYPGCAWPRVAVSIVKQLQDKYSDVYGQRPEGDNNTQHDKYDVGVIKQIVQSMTENAPYSKEENDTSRQITDIQNALVTAIARENVFSLLIYCDTDDNIRNYWGEEDNSAMTSDLFFVKAMTSTAVQKHLHYLMARNMHMSAPSDHQLRDVWFYKQQYVALGTINQWCVRRYLQSAQGAEEQLEKKCGIDGKWVNLRPEWFDTSTALLTFARLYVRNSEYAKNKASETLPSTRDEQEKSDVDEELQKLEYSLSESNARNEALQEENDDLQRNVNSLEIRNNKLEEHVKSFVRGEEKIEEQRKEISQLKRKNGYVRKLENDYEKLWDTIKGDVQFMVGFLRGSKPEKQYRTNKNSKDKTPILCDNPGDELKVLFNWDKLNEPPYTDYSRDSDDDSMEKTEESPGQ